MSFLERFKAQPRYKSTDPDVRLAAVQELGTEPEDTAVLATLAREDTDARVRRAAAARVDNVGVLAAIAVSDPDDTLRNETADRLAATASGDRADLARQALSALRDQKHLATVARSSPFEPIRTEALAKVSDQKALSSVARHALDSRIASAAADRVQDAAELINIALKTDHKDTGLSALERAVQSAAADRESLENIASRAKNKSVAKRARAILQAIDDAETARRTAVEQHRQRVAVAVARVEALAAAPASPDTAAVLEQAESEWRTLTQSTDFEVLPADTERFSTAAAGVRTAVADAEHALATQRELAERLASVRAERLSLCERVEALRGETILDDVAAARAEWEGLPAVTEPEAVDTGLLERFEDACRRAAERHESRAEAGRATARLEALALEAEAAAAQEDTPAYVWESISREWNDLQGRSEGLDDAVRQRFAAADTTIRERAEAKRAAAEKALRQQVQRLEQLIDRVQKRATAEDLTLREADKAARDLRGAIEAPPAIPHADRDALLERLKAALGALAPKLHELREMDEWKRFANAAVQEELIAHTEALRTKYDLEKPEDLEKAARELHDIQERWKQAAEAPRAQAQTLWHRYRQAADPIQAKAREFFAQRAEERQGNLQKKLALCERAEALAGSTDWIKTADELKKLQLEWQAIGPVPRPETRVVWKRFREACDQFFTRRNEDLAQRKEVWAANQAKKEALCARAEELAESREWERSASEIRRLQAEWKTVGPVRRSKSEALWQRFRAACDRFFDRFKRRDEIELEARQADREALAVELEALLPAEGAEASAPGDLLDRVRSLRTRWNQSTPAVRQGADPLSGRFVAAMERLLIAYPESFKGTELDVEASRQRMEKLCARVEGFISEKEAAPVSSSQALADMLREALAANTIGGRAGEESKWRSMADEVRQAQASWARLVPVPGENGRQLADRFHRACTRFFEQYRRRVPPQQQQQSRGRGLQTTR
jgi:hypothetical protein